MSPKLKPRNQIQIEEQKVVLGLSLVSKVPPFDVIQGHTCPEAKTQFLE